MDDAADRLLVFSATVWL